MPRPARFTDDDVLDAARACVAEAGPRVSIADIAGHLGGPVGSIYHRFASRDALMARLWVRSVQRFQERLFELGNDSDPHQAMIDMALHVPQYCRAHQDEATILTLYRQNRLLAACPPEVRGAVATVNDTLTALTRVMTKRRYAGNNAATQQWVHLATRVAPYGLVRPYLGGPIPHDIDDAVAATADAILHLGDR